LKKLGIETFEEGFDSLAIRIWIGYDSERTKYDECIELKYQNSKWSGTYYVTENDYNGTIETLVLLNKKSMTPLSGWEKFEKEILNSNISSLPLDHNQFPQKVDSITGDISITMILHAMSYVVEIATKDNYRLCDYYAPESLQEYFPELNQMVSLLELMRKEFVILNKRWRQKKK